MNKVNIKIDGIPYQVEAGLTILEAARQCGYEIPTLCSFNHGECSQGSCRVCLVEVKGMNTFAASCVYPVRDGMEIGIATPDAIEARRDSVELILSNHSQNCQQCEKNDRCELLQVAKMTGARPDKYKGRHVTAYFDNFSNSIVRDTSKCVLCGRCIARCENAHGNSILGFEKRGFETVVAPVNNVMMVDSPCIMCGQCVSVCPTGALMPKSEIDRVDEARRAGKHLVVQTAPAVRVALGEEFGMPIGSCVTGKMVAALRRLGFHKVYDTNFAADLTIVEEANELIDRLENGGKLPMFTSCSPGWINYCEIHYPELLDHVSTCKSPHQMMGAVIKSYYAKEKGIDPKDIFVVSIMPCTAKKDEKERSQLSKDGIKDVDAVLTVRELGDMIKRAGILFNRLPDRKFDWDLLGESSGAATIFGVTGGVMEAALRTAYFTLEGKEHEAINFEAVRGFDSLKEATVTIAGRELNVAVVSGMKEVGKILEDVAAGKSKYHFVEVMGCPGGCINGGGMPVVRKAFLPNEAPDIVDTYRQKRAAALYSEDERVSLRQSHNNSQVKALYEKYLGKPGSHASHELLHTSYRKQGPFRPAWE